jgi:hypothetical protein
MGAGAKTQTDQRIARQIFESTIFPAVPGESAEPRPATHSLSKAVGDPTFAFVGSAGCGDLAVYGKNAADTEILVVQADRKALNLSTSDTVVSIQDAPVGM